MKARLRSFRFSFTLSFSIIFVNLLLNSICFVFVERCSSKPATLFHSFTRPHYFIMRHHMSVRMSAICMVIRLDCIYAMLCAHECITRTFATRYLKLSCGNARNERKPNQNTLYTFNMYTCLVDYSANIYFHNFVQL